MSSRWVTVQVACVYIGTVVGAGFASGREIYQFFAQFGAIAYAAILLVTALFAWIGFRLMALGARLRAKSFRDVNAHLFGPRVRRVVDIAILLMLFGTTVAMLAGTGELFRERLTLPFTLGVAVAVLVTLVTMMFGMGGLLKVNSVIVPLLTSFVIYTTIHTWVHLHPTITLMLHPRGIDSRVGFVVWLNALLYAAMNIGLSIGVLVPLGGQIRDERTLRKGAILGAAGLGILLVCVTFCLFSYMPEVRAYAIPMGFIAAHFQSWLTWMFIAVLFGEIYSTLIGNVYALGSTVASNQKQFLWTSAIILVTGGILGHFGFRIIVAYAYTAFGWICLWFLVMLMFAKPRLR